MQIQTRLWLIHVYRMYDFIHSNSCTHLAKRAEGSLTDLAGANTAVAMLGLVPLEFFEAVCMKKMDDVNEGESVIA